MMVRIQASEQLDAIRVGVLAAADRDSRKEAVYELQQASSGAPKARPRAVARGDLAGAGIGLRVSPAPVTPAAPPIRKVRGDH